MCAIIDLKKYSEYTDNQLETYVSNFRDKMIFYVTVFNHQLTKKDLNFIDYIDKTIYQYDKISYDKIMDKVYRDYRNFKKIINDVATVEFG